MGAVVSLMPAYDLVCEDGHEVLDVVHSVKEGHPPCPTCGKPLSTLWRTYGAGHQGDEIDIWIRHGICNDDGSPKRYRSKEEIKRAAKAKGLRIKDDLPDAKPNTHRLYFT